MSRHFFSPRHPYADAAAPPLLLPPGLAPAAARRVQERLRSEVVLAPPAGFRPATVAGLDLSTERGGDLGYAGIVVLDAGTLQPLAQATAVVRLEFPYVPGLLSFRELPALAAAWERLEVTP